LSKLPGENEWIFDLLGFWGLFEAVCFMTSGAFGVGVGIGKGYGIRNKVRGTNKESGLAVLLLALLG